MKLKSLYKYLFAIITTSLIVFNLCACSKNKEQVNYASEVTISYNKSVTSTTLSKYMSSSRPVYFGISLKFNNQTSNSETYNSSDFYFVFKQKKTGGEEVENEYIAYTWYTDTSDSSFTIKSLESKNVTLWSNNPCYLNGTGKKSIPKKVEVYYAGKFIGSYVPQIN